MFCNTIFNQTKADQYINAAPIVHTREAFYVLGGMTEKSEQGAQIGKLDANSVWSKVGDLNTGRHAHNVIFDGMYALVVGGMYTRSTEKCSFTSNGISCTDQNPSLSDYAYYPELFMVPVDYCKSLN